MSATTQNIIERIALMKDKIAECRKQGVDVAILEHELDLLHQQLVASSSALCEGRVLKG